MSVIHEGGNLLVLEDGTLTPRRADGLRMTFLWRGRPCEAVLSGRGLALSAKLGRVPSSATNPSARARLIDALRAGSLPLPEGYRLQLDRDHALRLIDISSARAPTDMVTMLSALVRFSLDIEPLIDTTESMELE